MTMVGPRWYAAQTRRAREVAAMAFAAKLKFQAFLPIIHRQRHHNHRIETVAAPRFAGYFFVRFDRDNDRWQILCQEDGKRAGMRRIMGDVLGKPLPVPDQAIDAMRAFVPIDEALPRNTYQPGQPILVYVSGVPKRAVFVGYERGRSLVRMWVFGAYRITRVAAGAIAPDAPDESENPLTRNVG